MKFITSQQGKDFIKSFEKLSLTAYMPTPDDVPTIGYGCTTYEGGQAVAMGETISERRADQLFENKLRGFEKSVNKLNLPSQNMFDSLVSFSFNIGIGNFESSTLYKIVKSNPTNYMAIESEFNRWVYQKNKVLQGLVIRRKKEAKIYIENIYENHI